MDELPGKTNNYTKEDPDYFEWKSLISTLSGNNWVKIVKSFGRTSIYIADPKLTEPKNEDWVQVGFSVQGQPSSIIRMGIFGSVVAKFNQNTDVVTIKEL